MSRQRFNPSHFLTTILFILLMLSLPAAGTIVESSQDINHVDLTWEVSIQFSGTDTEGLLTTLPMWGAPTAIDYQTWTTSTPQVNGEYVYIVPSEWTANATTWFGNLTVYRVDLDGSDSLTSSVTCVVGFTWE